MRMRFYMFFAILCDELQVQPIEFVRIELVSFVFEMFSQRCAAEFILQAKEQLGRRVTIVQWVTT